MTHVLERSEAENEGMYQLLRYCKVSIKYWKKGCYICGEISHEVCMSMCKRKNFFCIYLILIKEVAL